MERKVCVAVGGDFEMEMMMGVLLYCLLVCLAIIKFMTLKIRITIPMVPMLSANTTHTTHLYLCVLIVSIRRTSR